MEIAKITSKGQVTIPIAVRKRLGLKDGDKVLFLERPEGVVMVNPTMMALEKIGRAFEGEAERVGLETEEDVVAMIKEIREERWALEEAQDQATSQGIGRQEAIAALERIQQASVQNGTDTMTLEEINEVIAEVRRTSRRDERARF